MPIFCAIPIESQSRGEFKDLDYRIMRYAFDCQNEVGRLADERIYQGDFAARLSLVGLSVEREVEIELTHRSFHKTLSLDFLINHRAAYELKRGKAISDSHRTQLLTYLYLLGLERGRLLNFAADKVEAEFVNAVIPKHERTGFSVEYSQYRGPTGFRDLIIELVRDWGTCLSLSLYREAVVNLLGGEDLVRKMLPLARNGTSIGTQRFFLLSPQEAFWLTTIANPDSGYPTHIQKLINLSPLSCIHWVNIGRHEIQLVTLKNETAV